VLFAWPADGADAKLVLHIDHEGVIRGTYDLDWRGEKGGPTAPTLTRPTGNGITWKDRKEIETVPHPEGRIEMLAKDVDVPANTYGLLGAMRGLLMRLRNPDVFATLPRGTAERIREMEYRWREAWRDRRVSVEELRPIVEETEALLQGKAH
jgi:hypothetical protein